jgi:predicted DNA-binding transcriptional regulator AlpA
MEMATASTEVMGPGAARYLDVHCAAAYLSVSRWTLYKLVERRRIPFIPIRPAEEGEAKKAIVRFDVQALDRWMAEMTVNPRRTEEKSPQQK